MKNTCYVNNLFKCWFCQQKGFFCYTPEGGDFETCPCCGRNDFLNTSVNYKENPKYKENPTKYDFLFEDEFQDDMRLIYKYCDFCKIIFKLGCIHYNGGCTSNVFNCHFIKKWKHKDTNIEYEGMPLFDDDEDWFNNVNNVEILEMYCPHNNNKCKKGHKNEGECRLSH